MSAKQDLKILLTKEDSTLTHAVSELAKLTGKDYKLKNISAKLRIDSLRYTEFKQIAKIFGYSVELVKDGERIIL